MAGGRDGEAEGGAEEDEERGGEGAREAGVGDEEEGVRARVPNGEVPSDGGERVRREEEVVIFFNTFLKLFLILFLQN